MISLIDVVFQDKDKIIFNHLNFHVERGGFSIVIGRPSTGKTTLYRLLSGGLEPTSGSVVVNGCDLDSYKEDLHSVFADVAFMPDNIYLDDSLTVLDNLKLINSKPKMDYEEALRLLGIEDTMNKSIPMLDGLTKRRVYLASLLLGEPKILIVDEPSGNLDIPRSLVIYKDLKAINEHGVCVLALTRNEEFKQFFKRTYHLFDGKIV